MGHPLTLSVSLILVPIAVFLAVILPGNHVLPFADLAVIPWMFVLIIPVVNGNGFRALVIGVVVLTVGLYIATNLSPLITTAALNAQYIKQGSGAISSICDGAQPAYLGAGADLRDGSGRRTWRSRRRRRGNGDIQQKEDPERSG